MVVFLDVCDSYTQKPLGTLEIAHGSMNGKERKTWEWRGKGGESDGGIWEWKTKTHKDFNRVVIELNSNIKKAVIGEMASDNWVGALIPPHQPWFANSTHNRIRYFGMGKDIWLDWLKK